MGKQINIHFRKATFDDSHLLFRWRNDEMTRKNSRNPELVSFDSHLKWFKQALTDPDRILLIAETSSMAVATIRFHRLTPDNWEMSWTVAPEFRGRGIGKAVVKTGVSLVEGEIQALVKTHNAASIRIAERAGFKRILEKEGYLLFSLRRQ